ncbi:MAG: ABC transporter ATP-binding protein [Clostridia bacterium]|nr:ABC transporter ATP-binding protein [Clostridia bacterium]
MRFVRQLWKYLEGFRLTMALAVACALGHTVLSLLPALFVREVVARVGGGGPAGWLSGVGLPGLMLGLLAVYAVRAVLYYLDRYLSHVAAWGMLARLRVRVYDHMQGLSHRFFSDRLSGELAPRAIHDVKTIEYFLAHGFPQGVLSLVVPLGMTVVLLFIDWRLTLLLLLTVPALVGTGIAFGRALAHGYGAIHRLMGEIAGLIAESVQGIEVIKAFGYERRRLAVIRARSEELERHVVLVNRVASVPEAVTQLLMGVGMVLVLGVGGAMTLAGRLPLADLVVFIFYLGQFYQPILQFDMALEHTQDALAASARVFEILEAEPDIVDPRRPRRPATPPETWGVEFDDVTFRYPTSAARGATADAAGERPALWHVSFAVAPGETVALVGHTGAGKSTVARLIPRFWDVDEGAVRVGGVDVREWKVDDLRAQIAVVPQDVFLFDASVLENIRVGNPEADDRAVRAAARAANAHEFIARLPDGYETRVGERGMRLSGGEKQRIAIARALLKNAPILILDEATSSVDAETEALIQEALERLTAGRTTIVIAHRLTTVEGADRILVLRRGELVEEGTHAELVARGGVYARLVMARMRPRAAGG